MKNDIIHLYIRTLPGYFSYPLWKHRYKISHHDVLSLQFSAIMTTLLRILLWVSIRSILSTTALDAPCDIFASGSTPCVAAHSTVRALFSTFNGPLYQVKRSSDNTPLNISVVSTGGTADFASQVCSLY